MDPEGASRASAEAVKAVRNSSSEVRAVSRIASRAPSTGSGALAIAAAAIAATPSPAKAVSRQPFNQDPCIATSLPDM